MNNISIVGRLTKDIELSTTPTGVRYTRFNVAVPSEFKSGDGERLTDFFVCIAWREIAETIAKYFKKGYPIGVMGSMNSRSYKKEDGVNQTIWELNVKNFSFIGTLDDKEEKATSKQTQTSKPKTPTQMGIPLTEDEEDDLPF